MSSVTLLNQINFQKKSLVMIYKMCLNRLNLPLLLTDQIKNNHGPYSSV